MAEHEILPLHPDVPWRSNNTGGKISEIIEMAKDGVASATAINACLLLGAPIMGHPGRWEVTYDGYGFGKWGTRERAAVAFCLTIGVSLHERA